MTWEEAVDLLKKEPAMKDFVRACFFDDPLSEAARRYYESTEWRAVRSMLPRPPGLALDIGAGRGISSYALARDGWDVIALEPDPSQRVGAGAIRSLFAQSGLKVRIEQGLGEALPFHDDKFMVVHCRQVLHHARDLNLLAREAGRVLHPQGRFIATREHVLDRPGDLQRFLDSHTLHKYYGGENAYLLPQYIHAIRAAGLKVERVLNPYDSDINLFPETQPALKRRIAKKLRLPWPALIPDFVLSILGGRLAQPGKLYTFLATKSHGTESLGG